MLAAAATARLAEAGVPSARFDAEALLAEALGIDRGRIPIADDATPEQAAAYEALLARRAAREPLQHILGRTYFGPLTLAVGPGVFVPRPETELLAVWAARQVGRGAAIVDLCAGGGGKTLALAALTGNRGRLVATDGDPRRLAPIHERLRRAKAQAEVRTPRGGRGRADVLEDLDGKVDRVLVDAPCTGSGTWRRNPDAKWRLRPGSLALRTAEQAQVLGVLTSERFCDKAVAQTWATLLDEGTYLCSMSTMHRILREHDMAGERRRQATHPPRQRPTDGIPGLPTHDNGLAHGGLLEITKVTRQIPGQIVIAADDPVTGHGNDQGFSHVLASSGFGQMAIGALMPG